MARAPSRLSGKPTYLTTQLAAHARRFVNDAFSAAGAGGYHYRLLAVLDEFGPKSQAEIGRGVNMDRSDVAVAVNELEALGQVERHGDPGDGRRKIVQLTPAGRRQLHRLDRRLARAQDLFMAPLADEDRATYRALLSTLIEHHAKAETS
jgi:MarR family transcriptional regulator, lower aerobic nicotinate degradation pathway regulator